MRFRAARQDGDVPCFGYALALAIILKDYTPSYVERQIYHLQTKGSE